MPDELNPYAPPRDPGPREPAAPRGAPDAQFTTGLPKGARWTMSFYPDVLHLQPSDGQPARSLDRAAFIESTTLNLVSAAGQLVVKSPAPAVILPLSPEILVSLRAWLDPALQAHLVKTLAPQRLTALMLGVLWVLPAGSRPLEMFAVAVGVAWLAWAAAATVKPHRALILANAVLWGGAALSLASKALHGSPFWLVFLIFFVPTIFMRIRSYRFYGPLPPAP